MKQSEKLMQLLELMQANPELPVIPCVDGDVVGGDEYYCWLGSWGESAVQEFIIGKERTYYREDDICEMNDVLYERYDPELVDNMTDEETRAAYNALPWKKAIFVDVHQYEEEPDAEAQRASTPAPGKTLPQLLEQLDAGECKGIKSATAYKIAEFAREQGYLE